VKYYDPKFPGSFAGAQAYEKAIKQPVKNWLKTQPTYTLHRPSKLNFPRRKVMVAGSNQQLQSDLIDFSMLQKYNDGMCYIVTLIDTFSKFAYVECIKSKNASANTQIVPFKIG